MKNDSEKKNIANINTGKRKKICVSSYSERTIHSNNDDCRLFLTTYPKKICLIYWIKNKQNQKIASFSKQNNPLINTVLVHYYTTILKVLLYLYSYKKPNQSITFLELLSAKIWGGC